LSNVYGVDIFKIILVIFLIIIFYVGISEQSGSQRKYISFEYSYILGFAFIGMVFLLYSFDFLMMFLSLELQNFSLYILINIQRNKKVVVETCIKYYILGGLSSGLILYGISLIYGYTGRVNLLDLAVFCSEISLTHLGLISGLSFIFFGFFIKLGLAPFHFWVPQIYEGSPNIVMLVLLTLPKFILFIIFLKLHTFVFGLFAPAFREILYINVFLSFLFGSLGALWQTNIKKFFAYSAITNSGFILFAFSLDTLDGVSAGLIYLLIYLGSTLAIFYLFIILKSRQENSISFLEFKHFSSLKLVNPSLVFILAINLFSMAGIPPLGGFLSKFLVFTTVLEEGTLGVLFLIVVVSLFTAYYYIRPIKILLFHTSKKPAFFTELTYLGGLFISVSFFNNLVLFSVPKFFWFIDVILIN